MTFRALVRGRAYARNERKAEKRKKSRELLSENYIGHPRSKESKTKRFLHWEDLARSTLGKREEQIPGGVLKKVLYGEAPPRGLTPYPFIYQFWQKRYPFYIPFIEKRYPFNIPILGSLVLVFM